MAVAVYMHYFTPGSLRLKTKTRTLSWDEFDNLFGEKTLYSRRWLVEAGYPYPGYCRAPGTGRCIPTLCNCKMLQRLWRDRQKTFKLTHLKANKTTVKADVLLTSTAKPKKHKPRVKNYNYNKALN